MRPNLLCHQQPVALINLGKKGRNHLPSCVPISSRAIVCFHISGECSKTHARPTGALFSLSFPHCRVIHFSSSRFSLLTASPAQDYPSWLREWLCCHFNIANRNHTEPFVLDAALPCCVVSCDLLSIC